MTNVNWSSVMKSDIGPAPRRFVLAALADHSDPAGFCFPSIGLLSGETQQSRSTVIRALKSLEAEDLIRKVGRERENGSTTSNLYRLNLELIASRKRASRKAELSELEAQWALLTRDDVTAGQTGVSERHPTATSGNTRPVDNPNGGGVRETPPRVAETPGPCQRDTRGGSTVTPPEPSLEPLPETGAPQPPAAPADGRASRAADTGAAAPASGAPASFPAEQNVERCEHNRPATTGCRACGTNPRAAATRAATATAAAAQLEAEQCRMCRQTPTGTWQRVDPDTGQPLDIVAGVPATRSCDHHTPHAVVTADIAAREAALDAARSQRRPATPSGTRPLTDRRPRLTRTASGQTAPV